MFFFFFFKADTDKDFEVKLQIGDTVFNADY